jgi:hypothetical protein
MFRKTPERRRLTPAARRAVLTTHIMVSVGLLGDSAGFLAVAIRAASTDDPAFAHACVRVLEMFALAFGIPLSFAALLTGLTLGLGSEWGVLRTPWVTAKLVLVVTVILVGALGISPALDTALAGRGGEGRLVAAGAWDVAALAVATGLSVYKPGRRRAARRRRAGRAAPSPS